MHDAIQRRWNLTAKITLFAGAFLALSLLAVGSTLWVAWNLEGGAAAVNEAGRLRMLSYRLAIDAGTPGAASDQADLQHSLDLLRDGDPSRPLVVPWDANIHARYADVVGGWDALRRRSDLGAVPRAEVDRFVARIDRFVSSIEHRLDFWNSMLHTAQLALAGLVVVGTMLMFFAAYLLVLDPVGRLRRGVAALEAGDYAARVEVGTSDELGELGEAFNRMAGRLQLVHSELEQRVRTRTADLRTEQQRLAALYEVSALVSSTQGLDELANAFIATIRRISGADAAVLRWTDDTARRYVLLAAEGMPAGLNEDERCLLPGSCHCGNADGPQVVHFMRPGASAHPDAACIAEGFRSLLTVPVSTQQRTLGEIDLLYRTEHDPDPAQLALLEATAGHLAAAMESLRGAALEREAALARERNLLAREMHDSIAQALVFMKIQVQLLRGALEAGDADATGAALGDLDLGVQESLADVRELLLHFRTRTSEQDIEPALRGTVQKFELQSGVAVDLDFQGDGQPIDPDVQIQVLHIIQESLSNVRKHAHARRVALNVRSTPNWRFEIRDDGVGFAAEVSADDAPVHVGQQIMRERAASIGATLELISAPGAGTTVVLELPATLAATLVTPETHHAS